MMVFKFGNTVYTKNSMSDWTDKFSPMYDESDQFMACSQTFTHEEEDLVFDYVYAVNACFQESSTVCCELYFVVTTGYEDIFDAIQNGEIIPFEFDCFEYGDDVSYDCLIEHPKVYEWVTNAANAFEVCDRIRGFYLDRCVNRVGCTGWDYINFALGNDDLRYWLNRQTEAAN